MAKKKAQAEPKTDDDAAKEPLEPNPFDRRANVMARIDQHRRDMLIEDGYDLEPKADGGDAAEEPEPPKEPGQDAAPEQDEPDGPPADDVEDGGEAEPEAQPAGDADDSGEPESSEASGEELAAGRFKQAPAPQEPLVKVTVEGEEKEIPLSEVVAGYQVRATADRRLQIANETLEQAEQLRTRLIQGGGDGPRASEPSEAAGGRATSQPTDQPPTGQAGPLDGIDWAKLGNDLQYASPEEAGNALRATVEQIINQGADPSATRDELESQILNRLEWQQSVDRFNSEYSDLVEDPVLANTAANFANAFWGQAVQQAQQNGAPRPQYWTVWDAAGKATRQWLEQRANGGSDADLNKNPNDNASPGPKPSVALSPERDDRKRAAAQSPEPRQPQRRSPADSPPVNSEQQLWKTRSSAISDMQKARGQGAR